MNLAVFELFLQLLDQKSALFITWPRMNTGLRTPGIASPLQKRYLARSNKDEVMNGPQALATLQSNSGIPFPTILRSSAYYSSTLPSEFS